MPARSCLAPGAFAASNDLFFSEYVEGSSTNKALEIYNGTGAPIDLAAGDYSVQMFFNGNPASTLTINLTGTVAAGDVFVLAQSSAAATILAAADQTNGSGWFNGDDAVVLRKGDDRARRDRADRPRPRDRVGHGPRRALPTTRSGASRRVTDGDPNGADAFDPATQWDGFATDTFDGLGAHTVTPPDNAPVVRHVPADGRDRAGHGGHGRGLRDGRRRNRHLAHARLGHARARRRGRSR